MSQNKSLKMMCFHAFFLSIQQFHAFFLSIQQTEFLTTCSSCTVYVYQAILSVAETYIHLTYMQYVSHPSFHSNLLMDIIIFYVISGNDLSVL